MQGVIGAIFFSGGVILLLACAIRAWYSPARMMLFHIASAMTVPCYLFLAMGRRNGTPPALVLESGKVSAVSVLQLLVALIATSLCLTAISLIVFNFGEEPNVLGRMLSRRRIHNRLGAILGGFAIYVMISALLSLSFGTRLYILNVGKQTQALGFLGLTHIDTIAVSLAGLSYAAMVAQSKTRRGAEFKAFCANSELASLLGLGAGWIIPAHLFAGGILAGLAGVFVALRGGLVPDGGFRWVLLGFAAFGIAGTEGRRALWPGLLMAALVLAGISEATAYFLGMKWADACAFAMLAAVAMLRLRR